MDCPIQIDNIKIGLSILYIKESQFKISKLGSISVPYDVFIFCAVLMKYHI